MAHQADDIRNLAFVGHGSSGKTAMIDAIAFLTQACARHGSSQDGSSISDSEPEEQERKQTLNSHLFHMDWNSKRIHAIDTPGHPDFLADALSSFRGAETAVVTIDCPSGATFNCRRLWTEAERGQNGRMVLLTKADADNVDLGAVLEEITTSFGDKVVPVTLPNGTGSAFTEIVDCLAKGSEYRSTLEERVAEADDELMEKFFEAGELSDDELKKYLPLAIAAGTVVPLLTCNPVSELGVSEFLDFVAEMAPPPAAFHNRFASPNAEVAEDGDYSVEIRPDASAPFLGLVFKVVSDPFVGKMSYIRVLRGTLTADKGFTVARNGEHERLNGLLSVQGKDTEPIEQVVPGDLFAVAKVESLQIGDTVCQDGELLHLKPFVYPGSMVAVAVTPKSRSDEQKIGPSLEKLAVEDPTFHASRDAATGELVVEGLSTLHLDVMFSKLKRRYKVEVEQHEPSVPYRETCQVPSEGHHRHKKQSGGRGQFGEVFLRLRPRDRGEGFEFIDKIVGGAIPRQFIPEVEKGIRSVMTQGVIAGCPVVDCEVEIYDGKFHDVDSDQLSFQLAGGRAFADAFEKAKPVLLEPVMDLEIHVHSRFTGDITSNLSSHRARMSGMDQEGEDQIIKCSMPLKEARGYQTQLRSITAGEGSFTMTFSHYDPVPGNIQQEIIAARAKTDS